MKCGSNVTATAPSGPPKRATNTSKLPARKDEMSVIPPGRTSERAWTSASFTRARDACESLWLGSHRAVPNHRRPVSWQPSRRSALKCLLLGAGMCAASESGAVPKRARHAIAMHGEPAMPEDFTRLPYADPAAPKGGRLVQGVLGTFDSLNPFVVK